MEDMPLRLMDLKVEEIVCGGIQDYLKEWLMEKKEMILIKERQGKAQNRWTQRTMLVPVDFSYCSRLALRKAYELLNREEGKIVAFHVIDHHFIEKCVRHDLGNEGEIKKNLFLEAKEHFHDFLVQEQKMGIEAEPVIGEGEPFVEINKKAIELDAEMIVMGSCGKANDMNTIFFGSTAEKVLRFITRPVLCVPPDTE